MTDYVNKINNIPIGGNIFDGLPTFVDTTLSSGVDLGPSETFTSSLSSILPNDGQDYMCMFEVQSNNLTGVSSTNGYYEVTIHNSTTGDLNNNIWRCVTAGRYHNHGIGRVNTVWLPIFANNRNVTLMQRSNGTDRGARINSFKLKQYYRLGSNGDSGNYINNITTIDHNSPIGDETVSGNNSVTLEKAAANGLNSVTISGGLKRSLLPDGYTQYDYITVNGDCYFITDYYPSNITETKTKTFLHKQPTSPLVTRWTAAPTNDTFGFYMGNVSGRLTIFYGRYSDGKYLNIENTKLNIEHDIYIGVNSITFDGTSYSITRDTFTSTQPIYIGAFNQTGSSLAGMMYGRIYPVEFIENGRTVRQYIPCKNGSGVIGLYEVITDTFISPSGTGTAKKGRPTITLDTIPEDYTRIDFLQSTGTQYIISGVVANFANNKIEQTATVQYTTSNANRELMGTNGYGFWGKNASNKIEAALGSVTVNENALSKNVVTWTTNPDGKTLTLNVNSNQYTSTASTLADNNYAYYVFALGVRVDSGAAASFLCHAKVWDYTIAVDDEVVCYLIPLKRNSDNVLGMYDVVTGTFKTNAGTGTFTAGGIQATPSITNPLPIVSNNGELKVSKNLVKAVYAGGMSSSKVYQFGTTPLSGSYTITSAWKGICVIVPVVAGKTYIRSGSVTNAGYRYTSFYANLADVGAPSRALSTVTTTSFTAPSGATYAVVAWITENSGTTVTFSNLQVELGSTATDYTPYGETYTEGVTETITDELNNSATAETLLAIDSYKDTQEILSGDVTRKVGVVVLDGTENWGLYATNNGYRSFRVNNFLAAKTRDGVCTHLPYYEFSSSNMDRECVAIGGNKTTLYINLAGEERTVNDFKTWLAQQYAAGTPVTFIYPLATETTETVTGQTLTTVQGDNTLTISQASIANLPIEANYDKLGDGPINIPVGGEILDSKESVIDFYPEAAFSFTGSEYRTYDLSQQIPNDGYAYELLVQAYTRSNQNAYCRVYVGWVGGDGNYKTAYLQNCGTDSNGSISGQNNQRIILQSNSRMVRFGNNSGSATGSCRFHVLSYRRLGTNE